MRLLGSLALSGDSLSTSLVTGNDTLKELREIQKQKYVLPLVTYFPYLHQQSYLKGIA